MFPFGSVLTQVPLIIIGALYMLYLGLYAVNKSKEKTGISDSGFEKQFEGRASVNDIDILCIIDFSKEKKDAVTGKTATIDFYVSYIDKAKIIPDTEKYSHVCPYNLFSRPPPMI
jgi:hypothetical protein